MSFPRPLPRSDGVLQLSTSATGGKKNGWAGGSSMLKVDSPAAVPSTAVVRGGIAYTPDGAMYTTTATPSATAQRFRGMVIRADGAMHIDKTVSGTISLGQRRNSNGVWITT